MTNFSSSIIFTVAALAATASVVQSAPSQKIVGGEQSAVDDFPYFVEMGGCGGALVAPDVVLFAAHCQNWKDKQLSIGAYETKSLSNGAQSRHCEEWKADPDYNNGGYNNNDFALCKLDEPVIIDESQVRLVLNEASTVPAIEDNLIVMGLGALTSGGSGPQFLHNVTVPTISNEDCNKPASYSNGITSAMLCAGYPEGTKDSCQGDSGGPIVKREFQNDGTFIDYHVGVVSWGSGCALPDKPGVYARTSSGIEFIKNTTCNEFKSVASWCDNPPPPPTDPCTELEIQVNTDAYAYETGMVLAKTTVNGGQPIMSRKYMFNFNTNDHSVCLEKNTCYEWEITDSYGDGLCSSAGCGSYSLTVINNNDGGGGVSQLVTEGNGQFSSKDSIQFCIDNNGNLPTAPTPTTPTNPPVVAPTVAPTNPPTPGLTLDPTASTSNGPTDSPTAFPTFSPTSFPSDSPTESPTGSPSVSPSVSPTVTCQDDPDFAYKNKNKKNCDWIGRIPNLKKKQVLCQKRKWKKIKLYKWCPETCGKVGVGPCDA